LAGSKRDRVTSDQVSSCGSMHRFDIARSRIATKWSVSTSGYAFDLLCSTSYCNSPNTGRWVTGFVVGRWASSTHPQPDRSQYSLTLKSMGSSLDWAYLIDDGCSAAYANMTCHFRIFRIVKSGWTGGLFDAIPRISAQAKAAGRRPTETVHRGLRQLWGTTSAVDLILTQTDEEDNTVASIRS
jgi:hypothetical protein